MHGSSKKKPAPSESERLDLNDFSRLIFADGIDPCFTHFSLESLLDRIEKNDNFDSKNK